LQFADFAGADFLAVLINDLGVIAGHGLARSAVAHVAGAVADKDVQHFGRTDAVEDVGADDFLPALAEIGRQRFARRDAPA
jgi:hypothetical protein